MVDFLFAIIEHFRYLLRLRRYKLILGEVGVFPRGWVTLRTNFRWKGTSPTTSFGVGKLDWLPLYVVSKLQLCVFFFVSTMRTN